MSDPLVHPLSSYFTPPGSVKGAAPSAPRIVVVARLAPIVAPDLPNHDDVVERMERFHDHVARRIMNMVDVASASAFSRGLYAVRSAAKEPIGAETTQLGGSWDDDPDLVVLAGSHRDRHVMAYQATLVSAEQVAAWCKSAEGSIERKIELLTDQLSRGNPRFAASLVLDTCQLVVEARRTPTVPPPVPRHRAPAADHVTVYARARFS